MEIFIIVITIAVAGWVFFTLFTKKGREISMFEGKVIETLDEEILQKFGVASSRIRVHKIQKKKEIEHAVTIEVTAKSFGSYDISPLNLSRAEALQLSSMLERAAK